MEWKDVLQNWIQCIIRVGWWISKVGENGVKWKLLGIENALVKGFFSNIIIFSPKNAYLRNEQELERIEEAWPHLKSKNNWGPNSKTLSNSGSSKRKTHFLIFLASFKSHLSSRIIISEKNPFAQHFIYINYLIWLHSDRIVSKSSFNIWFCFAKNILQHHYSAFFTMF